MEFDGVEDFRNLLRLVNDCAIWKSHDKIAGVGGGKLPHIFIIKRHISFVRECGLRQCGFAALTGTCNPDHGKL